MQNLKLTELLLHLSATEFKRLGDFVRSPFHNKNTSAVLLYDLFFRVSNEKTLPGLKREDIHRELFGSKKYNDPKIRSLLSEFKKLVEKFLTLIELENQPGHLRNYLIKGFCERNMLKNFNSAAIEISNDLKSEFNKNSDYYFNRLSFEHILAEQKGTNIEVNLDAQYFSLSDSIDYFFFATKLELANSLLSRKYHVLGNLKVNIKFIEEIIFFIKENISDIKRDNPIIYSEYLILMMMTSEGSDIYFHELQVFVLKNIRKYDIYELEQVYYPLINYGFNKVALGEHEYLFSIFKIYKTFERKGFYSEKKVFQDIDFISIIIIGLRLKKTAWVEMFYDSYKEKLKEEFKEDTTNLAKAMISYNKKHFDTAIGLLNKVNYSNSYYYLKSKETLIQIYYEQEQYETLQSLIDATKHYLKRRQGVLSIHYERYLKFLKCVNALLKARLKDKSEAGILLKEINAGNNSIAREWLLEKIKELS
ncbi:MAG: hypothetical protein ABIY50_03940 [Ignavibacteria bacterium]